jgi:uncharacterized protein (UPF0147 family)
MTDVSPDQPKPSDSPARRNPATRLLEILSAARGADPNRSALEAWCSVFEIVEPNSEEALFECQRRLLALRKLFGETELALRQIPDINEELFVRPVSELAAVVNIKALDSGWQHRMATLHPNRMLALKYAEDLLNKDQESCENEIPTDEINEILSELNTLYESIAGSSLPSNVRTALLDIVEEIRRGLHEYRVRGASALKDALSRSVGIIAGNKQEIDENSDADEIKALGRMLTRIDAAYSFAVRVTPLLTAAAHLLPALAEHVK